MPITSTLLKHVPQEDRDKFRTYFNSSNEIRDAFIAMCQEEVNRLIYTKNEDYDKGSWAYYQADRNGQIKVWKTVLSIMEYKQENK
jgi:hypothetical protein